MFRLRRGVVNSRWRPGPLGRHGGAVVSDIAPACSLVRLDASPPSLSMQSPGPTAAEQHDRPQCIAERPARVAAEHLAFHADQQILGFGAEHRRPGHAGGASGQDVSQTAAACAGT